MPARLIAVIPAYNEADQVGAVVRQASRYVDQVIVVDDGSTDSTGELARRAGATVLRHADNRGAGEATATGLDAARSLGAEVVVTLDADGQHLPAEISRLVSPILEGQADFVLGSCLLSPGMPWDRRLANQIANALTWCLYGVLVSDSQSGFKAFGRRALSNLRIGASRYEFCSELVGSVKSQQLRLLEVPVSPIYTEYSVAKGQGFWGGLATLTRLVWRRLTRAQPPPAALVKAPTG